MDRQFCPIGPFTSFGRLPRSNTVLLTTASPRAGTERNSSDAYSRTRPALCPECRSSFTGRPRLTSPTVNFDARQRERNLERLASEPFDLLVIGGGITGAGVALDAAGRGLRTALVERGDFAAGTSSRSSKLVHGGLRYLQQKEYRLVYEALAERQRLLDNAPHLVHPLPFLIPLFGRDGVVNQTVAKAYSSALWLYDATGGVRIRKRHKRLSLEDTQAHFPSLRTERLVAGFLYWAARTDDARLTLDPKS